MQHRKRVSYIHLPLEVVLVTDSCEQLEFPYKKEKLTEWL